MTRAEDPDAARRHPLAASPPLVAPDRPAVFQVRWMYARVRQPLMLGLLIAFWATPAMSWGHVLFAAAASAYIAVGIRFEERDLRASLGDPYRAYAARTPAIVPRPWTRPTTFAWPGRKR